jgi:acyl-lipid omega-6 desaturase (Delta-12 desaturase)
VESRSNRKSPTRPAASKYEIRAAVAGFASSSAPTALLTLGLDLSLYLALLTLCLKLSNPAAKVACSLAMGFAIARLFILGHDAAHGSLFPRKSMNDTAGRLTLLFGATPLSLWQLGHNTIHHGLTNLRGSDAVWPPYSPAEFRRLTRRRQTLQRFYRSPLGVGVYYAVELWWKRLIFPSRSEVGAQRRLHAVDSSRVTLYFAGMAVAISARSHSWWSAAGNVLAAIVLPVPVFFWLMGFAIFPHHTHPSVRWFADRAEWSFAESQLAGTVHVLYSCWVNVLFHHIFDHTAHHIDVRIPFYRLHEAQAAAESAFGPNIVVEKFCLKSFLQTLRECALYDYDQHRWFSFENVSGENYDDHR